MSFSDHKITAFTHRIADLPDQPNLPADELKARFDSSPEELRQSLNAVCDDAARLEARVEGIVVDTFGDTIDKEMLSDELAAELDGKATQTALSAEAAARESADDALDTRLTANETLAAQKCEIYFGTYTPSDTEETDYVTLGFRPKAVIMVAENPSGSYVMPVQLALPDVPHVMITITASGFSVAPHDWRDSSGTSPYRYIAFK